MPDLVLHEDDLHKCVVIIHDFSSHKVYLVWDQPEVELVQGLQSFHQSFKPKEDKIALKNQQ